MVDYREELLNKALLMMNEAGIGELDKIKHILIRAIGSYEISERCTDLAIADDNNAKIIKLFLAAKRVEGGSDRSTKTRTSVLRLFDAAIKKSFFDVNTFDILKWLAQVQETASLSTAETYRAIVSSLYSWMYHNQLIPNNPAEKLKPIKHPEALKRSFTPVEVDSLKAACRNGFERAVVEVLLSTGLRCEELCNLKWSDINWETKDVYVIEGKGGKNRITMMDDVSRKYLLKYRNELNYESEYVFAIKYGGKIKRRTSDSVWRALKVIGERAHIDEVNPHKFRHTFATTLYKRGLDIRMIQKLLGHSNISTTMIYIDSDVDMLRDAYKRCS